MEYIKKITADDVIRSGACVSGVYQVLESMHPNVSASMNTEELLPLLNKNERGYVIKSAMMDGYGYGYGDGDGYGYGYGYRYGED